MSAFRLLPDIRHACMPSGLSASRFSAQPMHGGSRWAATIPGSELMSQNDHPGSHTYQLEVLINNNSDQILLTNPEL